MINIYGPEGIGKTRLLIETVTFISDRDCFKDGIVYLDLKGIETTDAFKQKIKKELVDNKFIDEKQDI